MDLPGRLSRRLLLLALAAVCAAGARGQSTNSVSIGLANMRVQGENNVFLTNIAFQIVPAPAYVYTITGNVHGEGPLFSLLVPSSEPAATAFEAIDKGLSSFLQGSVANPGSKLPATLLNQQISSGTDGVFNATLGLAIDATGLASFSLTNVAIMTGGQPDTSDALVFDSGSLTITALFADVSISTLSASAITSGGATLQSSVICPNAFQAYFIYGTGTTLTSTSSVLSLSSSGTAQSVAIPVTGLLPHQLYHYRAVAADITGPSYGTVGNFKTADNPPTSGTFSAFAGITPITIPVLSHCIDPNGDALKVTSVTAAYGGKAAITAGGRATTFRFIERSSPTCYYYYDVADDFGGSSTGRVNVVNYATLAGNYSAVLLDANSQPAGYLRATLSPTGACTGSVTIGGVTYAFSGALDSTGQLTKTLASTAPRGTTVALNMVPSGDGFALGATVAMNALRLTAILPPAAPGLSGVYTMALPPPLAAGWTGSGYATVNVAATGAATVTGALPDGAPFTCATVVDNTGRAAIYSPLYAASNPGALAGALSFTGAGAPMLTGSLTWTKPGFSSAPIIQGPFNLTLTGSGGRYLVQSGLPALQFDTAGNTGHVTITAGNLNAPIRQGLAISALNMVSILGAGADSLTVTLQPATGLFTGKFIDPLTGQPRVLHGAILQSSTTASGYFLGDSQSGSVIVGQ